MTGENRAKFHAIQNLLEVTYLAGDAAFWIRAVWITLSYPEPDGQREVIARLAEVGSERSDAVHRYLQMALRDRD